MLFVRVFVFVLVVVCCVVCGVCVVCGLMFAFGVGCFLVYIIVACVRCLLRVVR